MRSGVEFYLTAVRPTRTHIKSGVYFPPATQHSQACMNAPTIESTPTENTDTLAPAAPTALRATKIAFAIKKEGKHFGLYVEEQLVAVTVYRRGAATLEALLRNCVKYSGRKLFRTALEDALTAPTAEAEEAKEETN
jgi:hypothetical protein